MAKLKMLKTYSHDYLVNQLCFGHSFIHRAAPAVKLVLAFIWSIQVALLTHLDRAFFSLIMALMILLLTRIPLSLVFRRLLVVNTFILFIWFMLPFSFSTPGEPIAAWGFLEITKEGVILALLITLKANAIVIFSIALLSTTPIHKLASSLCVLKIPEKIVVLFLLTIRYFYVIFTEYTRLRKAMKIRGFTASGFRWHTYTTFASLIGILLVRSIQRSERIYNAMLCRGYQGKFHMKIMPFVFKREECLLTSIVFTILITMWMI